MRHPKLLAVSLLAFISIFSLSAKCLENDSLRKAPSGDWYIHGEIHNETDVQGIGMGLVGTATFPDGAEVVGEATMCPSELSPGTFSVYQIRLLNTAALPRPDDYSVNVSAGKATSEPLPPLSGTFTSLRAQPFSGDIQIFGGFAMGLAIQPGAPQPTTHYSSCIAMYGPGGDVIGLEFLGRRSTTNTEIPFSCTISGTPADTATVRLLVWLISPGTPTTSASAVRISDPIPVVATGPVGPLQACN